VQRLLKYEFKNKYVILYNIHFSIIKVFLIKVGSKLRLKIIILG